MVCGGDIPSMSQLDVGTLFPPPVDGDGVFTLLVLEDGVFLGRRCTDAAQISTCVKSSANPGSEVVPHCGGRGDH